MKIAITGHRPNKLGNDYTYQSDLSKKIIKVLQEQIDILKPTEMISGMALGIDTIWAVLAIKNNIPLHAAIPCEGHSNKWPQKSKDLYHRILQYKNCESVLVSEGHYTIWCMQARNRYMVDRCDFLIAVWDGTPGGTSNCVRYAEEQGKVILVINPKKL